MPSRPSRPNPGDPCEREACDREGGALLIHSWTRAVLVVATSGLGCDTVGRPSPLPNYDLTTRRLVRLDWDSNADGRVDQRTYLIGNVALRSEIDGDGDGRVDRWEYVDPRGALVSVGTSSRNDGIEDRWTRTATIDGERLVEISTGRSQQIDRREYFRETTLVRAEEDTNDDGRTDKWERYGAGILRQMELDTTKRFGRSDRRLVYGADGQFSHLEADSDGDGRFERVANTPPPQTPAQR